MKFIVFILGAASFLATAHAVCRIPYCTIERGVDRDGGNYKTSQLNSFYERVTQCEDDPSCTNVNSVVDKLLGSD